MSLFYHPSLGETAIDRWRVPDLVSEVADATLAGSGFGQ